MKTLEVKEYDPIHDSIEIEGTRYSGAFFRELGCNFPDMVGQTVVVEKKEDKTVTLTRLR